jgi:hypothetical protein
MTFAAGEQRLSEWLEDNARVSRHPCEQPWTMEAHLISTLDLPLNLEQNSRCTHFPVLSQLRRDDKSRARQLPLLGGE